MGNIEDLAHNEGFIREIESGNSSIYLLYDNNFKLKNMEFEPKITYLAKAPKEFKQNAKIITFDIETYRDDNEVFIPYACGFYDGKNKKLYYLTDYKSPNDMISQCIEDMLQPKYHNYTVYAHNLAKFDISFIFRILVKKYNVSTLIPRGKTLIYFTVSRNIDKKKITLKFSDSCCLLPSSLAELGNSFKVETIKDFFPYNFVKANNLDYVGDLHDIKHYDQPDHFIFRYQLMLN